MDGSQKLSQRILMPLRERLATGEAIDCLSLTVAAWIASLAESVARGVPIEHPLAGRLAAAVTGNDRSPDALIRTVLEIEEVFGADLVEATEFGGLLEGHLARIWSDGRRAAIARLTAR